MGLRVGDSILAAADIPLPPGRNDPELGIERHCRQLKAHLVVPFAGAAMRNSVRPLCLRHLNQPPGNQRAGH